MPDRLHELGTQHHAAIRMRLDGRSTEAICETLGVKRRTQYLWFSDRSSNANRVPLAKRAFASRCGRI